MLVPLALVTSIAATQAPLDEMEIVAQSLRPDLRGRVDQAVGGLRSLPLYRLEIVVDPDARTVTGQEQIVVPAGKSPLGELFLRTYENAAVFGRDPVVSVTDCRVAGSPAKTEAPDPTVLHVPLSPVLMPGGTASVDLLFRVEIPSIADSANDLDAAVTGMMGSLGGGATAPPKGDHGVLGATSNVINLGWFFPVLAPRKGNFFDTRAPSGIGDIPTADPSNFIVSVVAPGSFKVVGTGLEVGRSPAEGNQTRTTLVAAAVRDFTIFLSKDYEEQTATAGGVRIRNFVVKADTAEGKKVLDVAQHALAFYEEKFGPYPWTELKVAEAPLTGAAGGVEYTTLVGVASMLYRPQASQTLAGLPVPGGASSILQSLLEGAVAHEVAHQWWMAIVGNDAQLHPFVDEPLAQYSAALYFEHRHGTRPYEQFMKTQYAGGYHGYRLGGGADGAVERPAAEFADEREYGAMIYCKAPGFYRAARKLLGDAAFFEALRRYETDHFLGVAEPDDFLKAASRVAPAKAKAVAALRRHWLREAHGDQDLGKPDLATLMNDVTGQPLDPTSQQLLQQMGPLIQQMMQSGGLQGISDPNATP